MTYDTFKQLIMKRLEKDIPEPKTVSIQSVVRNNGCYLDSLIIMEQERNISPALFLNYYYDSYCKGDTFQEVYEMLLSNYRDNRPAGNIDISFFTDFEKVKPTIVFKLVNYEKNKELLPEIPHIRFLDLAIVFYSLISMTSGDGNATILIYHSHLEVWNTTVSEIFSIAKANTPAQLPAQIQNMKDMLKDLSEQSPFFPFPCAPQSHYPIFILSNEQTMYGAASILYKDLLKEFAQQTGTDFYILPSSVHEVILVPAVIENCMQELSEMVREVNSSHVQEEEILADHAYFYSAKSNAISM